MNQHEKTGGNRESIHTLRSDFARLPPRRVQEVEYSQRPAALTLSSELHQDCRWGRRAALDSLLARIRHEVGVRRVVFDFGVSECR